MSVEMEMNALNLQILAQQLGDKEWADLLMYSANRLSAFADDAAELAEWRAMFKAFTDIPVVGNSHALWPNYWRQEVALIAFALVEAAKHLTDPSVQQPFVAANDDDWQKLRKASSYWLANAIDNRAPRMEQLKSAFAAGWNCARNNTPHKPDVAIAYTGTEQENPHG